MLQYLPNLITLLRIVLVAPLIMVLHARNYNAAIIIAMLAGASDALDGFLAKRFGWQTWIGGMLDPIADKLLLISCFVTLTFNEVIPSWITMLVVGRDVVIVIGAFCYRYLSGSITAAPTWLSKITTVVQIFYIILVLIALSSWFELPEIFLHTLVWLVATSTLISGVHYVVVWSVKARSDYRAHREKNP